MSKTQSLTPVVGSFSTQAAARITGLSVDMVNYLYRHKIVRPAATKRGRGVPREYSYSDVLLLRALSILLRQGISVLRLKKCMVSLQKRGGNLSQIVREKFIATDGYNVYIGKAGVLEMLGSGQMAFAFVLQLSSLRRDVEASILREQRAA